MKIGSLKNERSFNIFVYPVVGLKPYMELLTCCADENWKFPMVTPWDGIPKPHRPFVVRKTISQMELVNEKIIIFD